MKILFWNVRGLNSGGRKKQLGDLIVKHQINVVCLQETIKQNFTARELASLARGQEMYWNWVPPEGRSGGLLLGVNSDLLEVLEYKCGKFCQVMKLKDRESNFSWG